MGSQEAKLQIVVDAQDNTAGALKSVGSSIDSISSSLKTVGTYGAVAFAAVSAEIYKATEAATEQQNAQAQLVAVIKSTGDAAGVTVESMNALSASLSKTTGYTDNEITSIETMLIGMKSISADYVPKATQAILDFAARTGQDATSAAQMLGKALGDPAVAIGALTREHIILTQAQQDSIAQFVKLGNTAAAQKVILEGISGVVGGAAEQTDTFAFQQRELNAEMDQFQKAIGTALLPILTELLQKVQPIIEKVTEWAQAHPKLTEAIVLGTLAFTALLAVLLPIGIALPGLIAMFSAFAAVLGIVTLVSAPVLLVIGAIIAILAVLVANGYTTKEAWEDVWLGIKVIAADAANSVIGVVQDMINFVIGGVNSAIGAINRVISAAQSIPGIGKYIPSIPTISPVNLGTISTAAIASADLAGRTSTYSAASANSTPAVVITGNTLLSKDVATQIGDMIMKQFKLTSPI